MVLQAFRDASHHLYRNVDARAVEEVESKQAESGTSSCNFSFGHIDKTRTVRYSEIVDPLSFPRGAFEKEVEAGNNNSEAEAQKTSCLAEWGLRPHRKSRHQ